MPPSLAGSAGAPASASAPTGGGEADPGHDEYRRTDAHGDDGAGFVAGIGFGVGSEEGRAAGGAWASVGGADVRGEGGVGVDDAVAVLVVPAFGALVGGGGGRLRPPRRRRVILKPSRNVAIRRQSHRLPKPGMRPTDQRVPTSRPRTHASVPAVDSPGAGRSGVRDRIRSHTKEIRTETPIIAEGRRGRADEPAAPRAAEPRASQPPREPQSQGRASRPASRRAKGEPAAPRAAEPRASRRAARRRASERPA